MKALGACPPWAVLRDMIDAADSDRNGKVMHYITFISISIMKSIADVLIKQRI